MKRRTQIYLDEDLYQRLRQDARRRDISISRVIREKIHFNLVKKPKTDAKKFLKGLIELGKKQDWEGVPRNLSENIDYYLYGNQQ